MTPNTRTYVEVRSHVVGFHCWPDAPEPVTFLRARHRHVFHIRVKVEVTHDDRQVEFVLLKREVMSFIAVMPGVVANLQVWGLEFGNLSCEQIARLIGDHLVGLGYVVHDVGVSEDGEFEGSVFYASKAPAQAALPSTGAATSG